MFKMRYLRLFSNIVDLSTKSTFRKNLLISNLNVKPYSINYKTPTNRTKVFKPTTVAVTNANKHLQIELSGNDEKNLGRMSMERAKELADKSELKLVLVDESCSPPKFKLMTGHELYKAQIKIRDEHKNDSDTNRVMKEKEIDMNLAISDHDLDIKIKMAHNFYDKGHPIRIKIISKIQNKKEKNIPKLQEEFLEKLKKLINFAKFKIEKMNENQILIQISSKNASD
ncbi:translation initiation factor IF- mitochondrial [Brachionus plicatilis]|uniref:Translation initiation factor IF-mitochondrial n=1 Tax=Brachionus plicatilis TaxID=10195 RepID=A0A3M7SII2_BRAPC|nr:translation initiation factor IF- mitochondrial [Brachionus plicatilis]